MWHLRHHQTCFQTSGNRIGEIWPDFYTWSYKTCVPRVKRWKEIKFVFLKFMPPWAIVQVLGFMFWHAVEKSKQTNPTVVGIFSKFNIANIVTLIWVDSNEHYKRKFHQTMHERSLQILYMFNLLLLSIMNVFMFR